MASRVVRKKKLDWVNAVVEAGSKTVDAASGEGQRFSVIFAPIKTGRLRQSIRKKQTRAGRKARGGWFTKLIYAKRREFEGPKPYMRPGALRLKINIPRIAKFIFGSVYRGQ